MPPSPVALHHTAFVVHDLEATAQQLADALGVGPWNIWTMRPTTCRVRGVDSPFTFRVAVAAVGGGHFELVSPHSGRGLADEHLEQHGPGFHHTCVVYASVEDLRAAKAELLRQGRELLSEAGDGELFEFAYFAFPELASAVEVLFLDPAKLPPPEVVIQPRR